jgi:hypothetical protein
MVILLLQPQTDIANNREEKENTTKYQIEVSKVPRKNANVMDEVHGIIWDI